MEKLKLFLYLKKLISVPPFCSTFGFNISVRYSILFVVKKCCQQSTITRKVKQNVESWVARCYVLHSCSVHNPVLYFSAFRVPAPRSIHSLKAYFPHTVTYFHKEVGALLIWLCFNFQFITCNSRIPQCQSMTMSDPNRLLKTFDCDKF